MLILVALWGCGGVVDSEMVHTDDPDDTDDTDDTDVVATLTEAQQEAIVAAIEKDLRKSVNRGASAVQLAVWLDGGVVYEVGVGSAAPDQSDVEVGTTRVFQIGSDTKKLAALALLQQDAAGTLSLEDSVSDAIVGYEMPASPDWAGETTLHHLLSHQGGLFDYTPWDNDPADATLRSRAFGVLGADGWAHSPGGAMWNYANPNFSLAGLATEEAAGRPWADVVEDDLFAPLGLTRSFARESGVEADGNYAIGRGYVEDAPPPDPFDPFAASGTYRLASTDLADLSDNGFTRPAGLVWSTAGDQARLGGFLIDGDPSVLDDERLASLHPSHVRLYPALATQGYGYGLFVLQGISLFSGYYDVPVWLHGGNTLSFTSTFYVLPEQRLAVSVLSNGYGNDFNATIATTIEQVATLPAPITAPENPTTETSHAALVGTYVDPGLGQIVVGEADGKLTIAIPYLEETLGVAVGANLTFALTDVYLVRIAGTDYDFTFVADKSGSYRWIRNRLAVGTRVSPAFAPTAMPSCPRDPAAWLVDLAEAGQMKSWAAPFPGR